jgi:uncharacterized protein
MIKNIIMVILFVYAINLYSQEINKVIDVTGTHELNIEADQIILTMRIKTIAETLSESKNSNDEIVTQLLNVLKTFSKEKNNIQISPLSFGINYKRIENEQVEDGYYTSEDITYKLNEIKKYYDLIDSIIGIENVSISKSYYNNSQYEEHNKLAYEHAVLSAKVKAEYLAKKAEVKLGDVIKIEDNSNQKYYIRQSYPNPFNSSSANTRANEVYGKIKISRSIRIVYQLVK